MAEVQKVLTEIGADAVPQLLVFNKLDAIDAERYPLQLQDQYEMDGQAVPRVFLSAQSGKGLDLLRSIKLISSKNRLSAGTSSGASPASDSSSRAISSTFFLWR